MPSKLALILLLVSLLALFDIGLTFPTNALSLQTLERAADAEPAVNDLVERTDKPAEFDKYIECVDQIHECDILKEAHHFTTCASGLAACDPNPSSSESHLGLTAKPARAIEDKNVESRAGVTEYKSIKPRLNSTADIAGPSVNINLIRYGDCRFQCQFVRNNCRQFSYRASQLARCEINYLTCMVLCDHIPHKRNVEGADLQVRDDVYVDAEARDVEGTEFQAWAIEGKDIETRAAIEHPSREARTDELEQ